MYERACIHGRFIHTHTYTPAQMRAQASHSGICLDVCSHTHVYSSHTHEHMVPTHARTHGARARRVARTHMSQLCGHGNTPTRAHPQTARGSRGHTHAHPQLPPHPASLASAQHLPAWAPWSCPRHPHGGAVPPTSHAGWDLHTGPSSSLWPLPPADQPVLLEEPTWHQNLQVLRHASRAPRKASWRRQLHC